MLDFIVPRRNAVDIGANRGTYTYFLAKRCPRVYAYEPNPWMADFLRKAVPAHVDVRQLALSNRTGQVNFVIPYNERQQYQHNVGSIDNLDGRAGETIAVEVRRIDDESLEDIGFMKIDVEGHEPTVIAGARETIERDRPVMLIEILKFGECAEANALVATITAMDYECFYFNSDGLQHISNRKTGDKGRNYLFFPKSAGLR